jgi:DNA-binding XRE family transcriptional regulator
MAFKVGRCLLQQRLAEARMTQQELAEKIDMKPQQLSDYAANRYTMSLRNARTIAHALGCHIDDLYEWIEIPPKQRKRRRRQKE